MAGVLRPVLDIPSFPKAFDDESVISPGPLDVICSTPDFPSQDSWRSSAINQPRLVLTIPTPSPRRDPFVTPPTNTRARCDVLNLKVELPSWSRSPGMWSTSGSRFQNSSPWDSFSDASYPAPHSTFNSPVSNSCSPRPPRPVWKRAPKLVPNPEARTPSADCEMKDLSVKCELTLNLVEQCELELQRNGLSNKIAKRYKALQCTLDGLHRRSVELEKILDQERTE
eukprot:CAMPEP_0114561422 /NCGR_PEP_ID=MMETSP0114-20121206/11995_1 /TAXON_ID=31324 /ORGANISM="Goniomonas sp, Strain m" /LENGTH=225 /DNA_ID=CAMNT_0001747055 /DNA_START=42 /DNA_END=719 /DNA_ORIENTATION=+